MSELPQHLLWLIDDTPHWHAITSSTMRRLPQWRWEGFMDGTSAIMEYQSRAAKAGPCPGVQGSPTLWAAAHDLPQIVLMDYYIEEERGDDITQQLRAIQIPGSELTIVGHSSVAACSVQIVKTGGDLVLPKRSDSRGYNPDLFEWLAGRSRRLSAQQGRRASRGG